MIYLGHKYEFRLMSVNKSTILDFDAFGDELAKDIEGAFGQCHCVQGGNVHAIYVCEEDTPNIFLSLEEKWDGVTNHAIRSLTRFFSGKNIRKGEYFIKQMTWAPVPDQRRSYHDIESMRMGKDWFAEDQRFSVTWLRLYVMFKTLSYGWGDEDVYVGMQRKGTAIAGIVLVRTTGSSARMHTPYRKLWVTSMCFRMRNAMTAMSISRTRRRISCG